MIEILRRAVIVLQFHNSGIASGKIRFLISERRDPTERGTFTTWNFVQAALRSEWNIRHCARYESALWQTFDFEKLIGVTNGHFNYIVQTECRGGTVPISDTPFGDTANYIITRSLKFSLKQTARRPKYSLHRINNEKKRTHANAFFLHGA